ncbi:MAG: tellurite resistance TerB family protein [Methylobacterium mesophilicum]|nr:tellurite resistance TerB family protein [Methylobacterium mesophilicum]
MFDPKKLLDTFLGAGGAQRGPGQGASGGLGGLAGGLGGGLGGLANTLGSSEGIKGTAGQALEMARRNPIAAGAILAGVLGTGAGRGVAGSAIKLGGLAAIASMAYKAYQDHQAGKTPQEAQNTGAAAPELLPPPPGTDFHPATAPQGEDQFALTLIRAMIAAAKADGHIDDDERARIGERSQTAGLDDEAGQFLQDELKKPIDLESIVAGAQTEAQKVELYTAARVAVDADNRAERGFLDQLAGRLGLEDALIAHVEATVASAKAPMPAA